MKVILTNTSGKKADRAARKSVSRFYLTKVPYVNGIRIPSGRSIEVDEEVTKNDPIKGWLAAGILTITAKEVVVEPQFVTLEVSVPKIEDNAEQPSVSDTTPAEELPAPVEVPVMEDELPKEVAEVAEHKFAKKFGKKPKSKDEGAE